VVSRDGGRSWAAEQRSTISAIQDGQSYELKADTLVYDTEKQHAAASGNIVASLSQGGQPPIRLSARRLELDMKSGQLTVSGGLTASYGDISLSSKGDVSADTRGERFSATGGLSAQYGGASLRGESLSADLKSQRLTAGGGAHLEYPELGLTLDAGSLSFGIKSQQIEAGGGVTMHDSVRGVTASADSLSADMKAETLTVSGSPTVQYAGSTFTGEKIVIRQQNGKTVVDVEGPQRAKIDVEALQGELVEPQKPSGDEPGTAEPEAEN
jgi:lipopolysaccharide export system protein LptA